MVHIGFLVVHDSDHFLHGELQTSAQRRQNGAAIRTAGNATLSWEASSQDSGQIGLSGRDLFKSAGLARNRRLVNEELRDG